MTHWFTMGASKKITRKGPEAGQKDQGAGAEEHPTEGQVQVQEQLTMVQDEPNLERNTPEEEKGEQE